MSLGEGVILGYNKNFGRRSFIRLADARYIKEIDYESVIIDQETLCKVQDSQAQGHLVCDLSKSKA